MLDLVQGIVLVLESVFPSPGGGGAEAQVGTIGHWLAEHGIATTIVVPMVAGGPQVRREVIDGAPVLRIGYPKWPLLGLATLLVRLALLLVVNRARIDAIHAHIGNNMAAIATVVGRLLGKPVIVKMTGMTEMRDGVLDPAAGLGMRARRLLLRQATAIQATSSEIAERLVACGFDPRRIHRIPNAVDVDRFDPVRRRPRPADAPLTAIYVGRLEPEKGVELLVEAWAEAFRDGAGVRLLVVGSGSLEARLRNRAETLGVAASITFAGQSPAVEHFLGEADFGVLASHAEGLSNTMLETLAAGLPMIVSRVSGAEDFVEPDVDGWLFEPGDRAALAAKLRAVRELGRERLQAMGAAGRQRVVGRASMPAVGARLLALYGLDGRPAAGTTAAPRG